MTGNDKNPARQIAVQGALAACALWVALVASSSLQAAKPETTTPPLTGVVNLNTASPDELQLLPGVGEVRAVAIVATRKERGGFKEVDELLDIKGIGSSMLARMRPFVTLTGKTTARRL
jgi:competence protein ComEA